MQIIATHPTIKSIELIGNGCLLTQIRCMAAKIALPLCPTRISETGGRYIADGIRANNPVTPPSLAKMACMCRPILHNAA